MKSLTVEEFVFEVESAITNAFTTYEIQILFRTEKSFKANIYLQRNVFIAVRYNARNERMDFALIKNNQRIFGYDNLKDWHYHPHEDPSQHIPCEKPSIKTIITDLKQVFVMSKQRRKKREQ